MSYRDSRGRDGYSSRGYDRDRYEGSRDSRGGYGYGDRDRDTRGGGRGYGGGYRGRGRGRGGYRGGRRDSTPGGGAEHLARIHGTEEDRVNCPFYFKIGACRHGDRCSRLHNKPLFSQTILINHMYDNPLAKIVAVNGNPKSLDQLKANEEFDDFFEEVYEELCTFGNVEEMHVCDNLGDHLVGNIYVKYEDEEDAAKAQKTLYGRFYSGKPIICEFSPVTDFREARCRQFDEGTCNRGGYCNFMHVKTVAPELMREFEGTYNTRQADGSSSRSGSRSRSSSPRKHESSRKKSRRSRSDSRSRYDNRSDSRSRHSRHRSSRRSRSRSMSPTRDAAPDMVTAPPVDH